MSKTQKCAICSIKVAKVRRYPNYVCLDCRARASDEKGQLLRFYNKDLSGGFLAFYVESGEKHDSHVCYIDGVKCYADEAHFGGIVIEVEKLTWLKILVKIISRFTK